MRAAVQSQPKVPQKRLRFDDCVVTEPASFLSNGHSTEKEPGAHVNRTNGEKAHEPEDTDKS